MQSMIRSSTAHFRVPRSDRKHFNDCRLTRTAAALARARALLSTAAAVDDSVLGRLGGR